MSQYKVPQNVEAEDKILGPLTFKQFIYACIGVGWAIICFAVFRFLPALMLLVGFPPSLLFLLLAFYTRDGQNFEQLLIAMVGYFTATRKRVWIKEDISETFHVEPTKIAAEITQRDPKEVKSELEKLATLIDSRGWNLPPEPETYQNMPTTPHGDRMAAPPKPLHPPDEPAADMLDLQHSPLAQNLAQLLAEASDGARTQAVNQMAAKPGHRPAAGAPLSASGVTPADSVDILKLATLNDDLTVSQIAAQATRNRVPSAKPQTVDIRTNAG